MATSKEALETLKQLQTGAGPFPSRLQLPKRCREGSQAAGLQQRSQAAPLPCQSPPRVCRRPRPTAALVPSSFAAIGACAVWREAVGCCPALPGPAVPWRRGRGAGSAAPLSAPSRAAVQC